MRGERVIIGKKIGEIGTNGIKEMIELITREEWGETKGLGRALWI